MRDHPLHDRETAMDRVRGADRLTTLSKVLDPKALAQHLCLFSLPPWNWGAIEEVQVRVLRPKLERCTLEIRLRSENGWHSLIGKVYGSDRADVFQAMERIGQAGFGPQEEFSIPQPLVYLSSLRLLVQEKVEGPRAKEIFATSDERGCAAAAERCARWLARFHAIAPKAGPVSDPDEFFNSESMSEAMQQCLRELAGAGSRIAEKSARLLEGLKDAAGALSPVEMHAGHGSYSPSHVIPASGRTVVFDWDGYDVADPARDLGRFLASLRRLALVKLGSIRALDAMAEIFLSTYLDAGQPEALRNLRFYEAAACLKLAKHSFFHTRIERMEATLDEALCILEQEPAVGSTARVASGCSTAIDLPKWSG